MSERDDLLALLKIRRRTLNHLKQQEAGLGLLTPPYIKLEIEDTEAEIEQLLQQLAELEEPAEPAPPPSKREPEPVTSPTPGPVQDGTPPVATAAPALVVIDKPIRLELVRIPAGPFLMGEDRRTIDVAEFHIGKYPITNAQYAAFVYAKSHKHPIHWKYGRIPPGKENHPVVDVSWRDAVAFCAWLSQSSGRKFRLPTEEEWEKAARGGLHIPGPDGALIDNPLPARSYPWGDEFDPGRCNTTASEWGNDDTTLVGSYSPAGDSPYGVADMVGNVWEWCLNEYEHPEHTQEEGDKGRVARGGVWSDELWDYVHDFTPSSFRNYEEPDGRYADWGFRVVALA